MDANLADLLKILGSDLIKIAGPALIAAIATYKATRAQYEAKLIEVEKTNEIAARKAIFEWLKDRERTLKDNYDSIANGIGQALGFATADSRVDLSELSPESKVFADLVVFSARLLPGEIDRTLKDMQTHEASAPELERKLRALRGPVGKVASVTTLTELKDNAFLVLEAYTYLLSANQLVLESQINVLFAKYIEP